MQYMRNTQTSLTESLSLASMCPTDYLCGAVETTDESGGWARPQRFTERQRRALTSCLAWHPGQYRQMAQTTAGVCLCFATDASNIALAIRLDNELPATKAMLRGLKDAPFDGLSLVIDGRHAGSLLPENDLLFFSLVNPTDDPGNGVVALPGLGVRREVCLWFPCMRGCVIRELWTDGSYVEPLPSRQRLLVLGDEVGQGCCIGDSAFAWPVLLAQRMGLELVNQSVAGQVFQPSCILDARVDHVEQVVVELGGNYARERCDVATVAADTRGFLLEVLRHWPKARRCALTPTWLDVREPLLAGNCFAGVPRLVADMARAHDTSVVEGRRLVPEGLRVLPSGATVLGRRDNERLATRLHLMLEYGALTHADLTTRALGLLTDAPTCALPAFETIKRGRGEVLLAHEGCVMVRACSGGCMLWASDVGLAQDVCGMVREAEFFNVLGKNLAEPLGGELELSNHKPYHVCVYNKANPVPVDHVLASCIRVLDESYVDEIYAHYQYPGWLVRDLLIKALNEGRCFGAFVKGELVGFVGEHPEGSIGMLEVYKSRQRAGWGAALLAAKTNDHLRRGETPWAEVYPYNKASLRLHKKLGFTVVPASCACYLSEGKLVEREENGVECHER